MATTVKAERGKLNDQYAALRIKILEHYRAMQLVGRVAVWPAYKLPPKLGHWGAKHSELVRSSCHELDDVVQGIETLAAQRSADLIKARHAPRKPGGRRKGAATPKVQINPGEWPPKYK